MKQVKPDLKLKGGPTKSGTLVILLGMSIIWVCREKIRKAEAQFKMQLGRDVNCIKKGVSKYVRNVRERPWKV